MYDAVSLLIALLPASLRFPSPSPQLPSCMLLSNAV
uniref:Uncharacterized protein n=1 Tax=Phakopsora pachyrhizi TaxID=170000 RepID=A0A0S1MKB6_PHAPC